MGTRTNILIENGESRIWLYRHWDGYPSCTGKDLAEQLIADKFRATAFLASLLAKRHEQASYQSAPSSVYELTTALHGDIEWFYRIQWPNNWARDAQPVIGWGERSYKADESPEDAELKSRHVHTFEQFVEYVNSQISQANARLLHLKSRGEARFQDYEPDALIDLAQAKEAA